MPVRTNRASRAIWRMRAPSYHFLLLQRHEKNLCGTLFDLVDASRTPHNSFFDRIGKVLWKSKMNAV